MLEMKAVERKEQFSMNSCLKCFWKNVKENGQTG